MKIDYDITEEILKEHDCLEEIDKKESKQETKFKQRARLQQSIWRIEQGLSKGWIIPSEKSNKKVRSSGCRIEYNKSNPSSYNFLDEQIVDEVNRRMRNPEPHQMIRKRRLWSNLLSSMPMCFNLFGMLRQDKLKSSSLLRKWIPDIPGNLYAIRFEWSPGRSIPGQFLENRSAFDCAIEFRTGNKTFGILGIETKYHEHAAKEKSITIKRLNRYKVIAKNSGIFKSGAIKEILGSNLQQIWQDHLLVLSMLQHSSNKWNWGKFILVHPEKNPSFAEAGEKYKELLMNNDSTFEVRTIESVLKSEILPLDIEKKFRHRYLW